MLVNRDYVMVKAGIHRSLHTGQDGQNCEEMRVCVDLSGIRMTAGRSMNSPWHSCAEYRNHAETSRLTRCLHRTTTDDHRSINMRGFQ